MLAGLERISHRVFATRKGPVTAAALVVAWHDVRARIGRPTMRIHDLRHSFASMGLNNGEDLGSIGGLLGHADKTTTMGYAHLAYAPVRDAADRVGDMIALKADLRRRSVKKGAPPAPRSPKTEAEDRFAAVKAFMKAGKSITRYCEETGLDPDLLRRNIIAWRNAVRRVVR